MGRARMGGEAEGPASGIGGAGEDAAVPRMSPYDAARARRAPARGLRRLAESLAGAVSTALLFLAVLWIFGRADR